MLNTNDILKKSEHPNYLYSRPFKFWTRYIKKICILNNPQKVLKGIESEYKIEIFCNPNFPCPFFKACNVKDDKNNERCALPVTQSIQMSNFYIAQETQTWQSPLPVESSPTVGSNKRRRRSLTSNFHCKTRAELGPCQAGPLVLSRLWNSMQRVCTRCRVDSATDSTAHATGKPGHAWG